MVKSDGRRKRHARLPSLRAVLTASAVLGLAALQSPIVPAREGRIAGEARRAAVTLREGGDSRIRLTAGEDLGAALGQRAESLLASSGTPLSLASADFDGDGVSDLAAGYRLGNAGALVFWRGNVDSIHPNAPEAVRRKEKGESFDSPFFPARLALESSEAPDWLFAGDFDGDGAADLVFAARGSSVLHILPGNGGGGFGAPRQRDFPGAITAMAGGSLDMRGGTLGIAVAILGGRGASLLVLEQGSAGTLDAVALPAPAAALAIVGSAEEQRADVAAACGAEILLLHRGADSPAGARLVERRSLPFFATALETGHFGTGSREGLALMAEDGRSYLLLPGEVPDPGKFAQAARVSALPGTAAAIVSPAPHLPSRDLVAFPQAATQPANLKDWFLTEATSTAAGDGRAIRAARISGSEADDLLVVDGRGRQIEVVSQAPAETSADSTAPRALSERSSSSSAAMEIAGEPVAVLPMRLNEDALSDLVVLRAGSITPAVALSAAALTLTVNSNGDTGDAGAGNGICADSNGNCTLRAAIQEANASAGADTINFAIPGAGVHTVTTGTSLPAITQALTIDATTQPGYAGTPLIELSGTAGQIGLQIQVSDCVVRGLAVNGYLNSGQTGGVGIYVVSGGPLVKNALVEANFIGTDPAGTTAKPNYVGLDIENTSLNIVGGTTAAARNLISGNGYVGIQVVGPGASNNTFQGNYVGTRTSGTVALPNAFAGFNIFGVNTVVGGAAAGAGNLISGNNGGGVYSTYYCLGPCFGTGTVVKANKIGTNPAGTAAVGNTKGVVISSPGSPNATIANNLISGNPSGGIQVDESLTSTTVITGNFIGTDVNGAAALGNTANGGIVAHSTSPTSQITIGGGTGTTPGGACTGSCNLISANSPFGVYAFGSGPVTIVNNFIGTNVNGTAALGNDPGGVVLAAGGKTLGSSAASGNLISGNGTQLGGGFGVLSQSTASPGNIIKGNLIGTTTTGNAALPNQGNGVILGAYDTMGSVIDSNVVSGNAGDGVSIPPAASSVQVMGNYIGVRSTGAALGNAFGGVTTGASDGVIRDNFIAHNSGNGVTVVGSGVRNTIRTNKIDHNGGLGIDLGGDGVTANDAGDADSGPNDFMNSPENLTAVWDGASTIISGHLDTPNPETAVVEIFSNSIKDPSDHGQGESYVGPATPDTNGNFCLTIVGRPIFSPATAPRGVLLQPPWLSATATNAAGSTSEFSSSVLPPVSLIALEVNQSTQDWKNSIPLIKDKTTYVRAHLRTTNPAGPNVLVTLQLRGFRGGVELTGSPLTPLNFGSLAVVPGPLANRSLWTHSANFRLPDTWLNGTIDLRLERTDGAMACNEPREASLPGSCGNCGVQVAFEEGSTVKLKLPLVSWTSPNGTVHVWDDARIDGLIKQVNAIYPIASLPDVRRGSLAYKGFLPGATNKLTVLGGVNKDLATMRLLDGCATELGCQRIYYGVIKDANLGGEANAIPGIVASGDLPPDNYNRRNRHNHEIGHVLGNDHTSKASQFGYFVNSNGTTDFTTGAGPCGEYGNHPPKPGTFPNFYNLSSVGGIVATLGPMTSGDNALVYGIDTSDGLKLPDPFQHFDVMSYCFNDPNWRWISDYTYTNIHSEITTRFPASQSAEIKKASVAQDYILVRGAVDSATNAGQIEPLLRLPSSGTPDVPPAGPWTLQMRNIADGVVSQVTFTPTKEIPEPPAAASTVARFVIPVAFDAAIKKAVVLRDGVVVATRTATANAPTVTVTSPNGGENVTADPVLIQWTASDADADFLLFTVQFSADNGAAWDTLILDTPDLTLSVPHSALKKTTNGLIRVIASDGFNTAVDQSNAVFSVSNNAPSVSISMPSAGQLFAGSQQVVLEAFAHDVEDGLLTGASLQWSSNVNGSLGSGAALLTQANLLTPGSHTITVTATDSNSAIAQASVNIVIAVSPPATAAEVSIAQSASPQDPVAGSPLVLKLPVSNAGPNPATNVTVTDTLPAGAAFSSAGATQGSCGQASGVVTCNLGTLAVDATATVTITVMPPAAGQKTNAAAVTAGETDPVPANNASSLDMLVEPVAPTVSSPSAQSVCAGASAIFSATGSGAAPIVYQWRRNGFALSNGGSVSGATASTLTINPAAAGDAGLYDVLVVDGFGQNLLSPPAVLTVNPPPSAAIAGPAAVCATRVGNHASVPSAGPGATYAWSITNGTITAGAGTTAVTFTSGASGSVTLNVTVTGACGGPASNGIVVPIGACSAQPQSLVVDPSVDISNGNGIFEPGETAIAKPFWKNPGGSPLVLSGTATAFTGLPGAVYTRTDSSAGYGSIAAGATNDCAAATGNCYEISVSNPGVRPAAHWDAVLTETLSDGDAPTTWPIHIGASFTDVPTTHTFYPFVERIFHNGVTTGCTPTTYCPDANVFRLQMAIFIARSQAGGDGNIPSSGSVQGTPYNCTAGGTSAFTDIAPDNPFCRHVHYIFSTGVTTGCVSTPPRQYCPNDNVTRGQMALFIARAVAGTDAAVPQTYGPDPVTGRSYSCNAGTPNLHFTDIATSDIFCRHTHYLWARDVISGFPDGSYGPALPVIRGAMAKFLANGFGLTLIK